MEASVHYGPTRKPIPSTAIETGHRILAGFDDTKPVFDGEPTCYETQPPAQEDLSLSEDDLLLNAFARRYPECA